MKRRQAATAAASITLALSTALLAGCASDEPVAAQKPQPTASIPALPEQQPAPSTGDAALAALERCIAGRVCQLMSTQTFSNATIEIYQENADLPAVHVLTSAADGEPTVWSLKDEHAASYQSITCGLANCLLDVMVGPESIATVDLRMVSRSLTGHIEGAAVGGALATSSVDLNADGVLDLVTTQHLVQADGTELFYFRTYLNDDRTLVATGCTLPSADTTPPVTPQTRTCPSAS